MFGKILYRGGAALALLLALAWAAGAALYPRRNPPERHGGVILSPAEDDLLRRACFDCHSNETRYPWYASLPVVSLLLGHNIAEARHELNFSEWDRMTPRSRREGLQDTLEELRDGEMPPFDYLWLHPDARLGPPDVALLEAAALNAYGVRAGAGKSAGGRGKGSRKAHRTGGDHDD
jgi:hypothetical protein